MGGSVGRTPASIRMRRGKAAALRGSSDFTDLDSYRGFIAEVVGRANAHRTKGIEAERAVLLDLPVSRTEDCDKTSVNITSSSGFVLRRVFYTVPSRLIGHRLGVHIYDDRLELFLSSTRILTLPRGRAGATGPNVHVVNYRHVIHSLKKKPMALLNLVYRDTLFPREAYRRCFETALERLWCMEPRWYARPFPGWLADPDCVWFRRTDRAIECVDLHGDFGLLGLECASVELAAVEPLRNLSTTLRHRRFLFTDSFLLLWKWRVG